MKIQRKKRKNKMEFEKNKSILCKDLYLIGCYSSILVYWQKFNTVRYYLTAIQNPKSIRIFDYPVPFPHTSEPLSRCQQGTECVMKYIPLLWILSFHPAQREMEMFHRSCHMDGDRDEFSKGPDPQIKDFCIVWTGWALVGAISRLFFGMTQRRLTGSCSPPL